MMIEYSAPMYQIMNAERVYNNENGLSTIRKIESEMKQSDEESEEALPSSIEDNEKIIKRSKKHKRDSLVRCLALPLTTNVK